MEDEEGDDADGADDFDMEESEPEASPPPIMGRHVRLLPIMPQQLAASALQACCGHGVEQRHTRPCITALIALHRNPRLQVRPLRVSACSEDNASAIEMQQLPAVSILALLWVQGKGSHGGKGPKTFGPAMHAAGRAWVGKVVLRYWEDQGGWWEAHVGDYSVKNSKHKLIYDAGGDDVGALLLC